MDWFKKFMYRRYGIDEFGRDLAIFNLVLYALSIFLPRSVRGLGIILYIPFCYCLFRIFSKNVFKRKQENYKYLQLKNQYMPMLRKRMDRIKDLKYHKYFKCPNCKQELRVPRKQGKITVTCPKCRNSFKAKS